MEKKQASGSGRIVFHFNILGYPDTRDTFLSQQREIEYEDSVAKEDQPVVSNIYLDCFFFFLKLPFWGGLKMELKQPWRLEQWDIWLLMPTG